MTDPLPTLWLFLTPKVNPDGKITGLTFSLTIRNLSLRTGDYLCTFGHRAKAHPSSRLQHFLQGIPATVRDNEGTVPFNLVGEGQIRNVHVTRDVLGDVVFASNIHALDAGETCDDDFAPRRDQGGVIGAGWYFLPQLSADQKFDMSVEWDLENCPDGTRTVCSFGEGPGQIQITGNSDLLLDCVFAAGPLRSFPEDPPSQGAPFGGTYWFGDLPDNLDAVKDYATKIFPAMAEHFKDDEGSYRAFLRRVPKGLKGVPLESSSMLDYDEDTKNDHDWDLVRLLNRTMVSTWAQLNVEEDGSENEWFTHGLSHLFTVYLPFRFKQRGPDYFRATVNDFLSAYFTNPLVIASVSDLDALDASKDWYVSSAKATRAFVYMLKMDTYLRRAAKERSEDVERPIDELVRGLCVQQKHGGQVLKGQWLEGIAYWLGREDTERYFQQMLEDGGRLNELSDMISSFGATYGPRPVQQERLEFGFDKRSLQEGVVRGIVQGSRAAEAGVSNGDRIVWCSRPETCTTHFEERFKLVTERKNETREFEYWPRSREKVTSWQVLERPKPAADVAG